MTLPPEVRALADEFYRSQQIRARALADAAQTAYRTIGPNDPLWQIWQSEIAGRLTDMVALNQMEAARAADIYMYEQARVQGLDMPDRILPEGFRSPLDELRQWLGTAPAETYYARLHGLSFREAHARGQRTLVRMVGTLTQDAGREATGVALAVTPGLDGYYRKLTTPSCDRCAILAGRYYDMAEAFKRHPACDCVHVPASDLDLSMEFDAEEAVRQGKVMGLSEAERDAILDGEADMNRIVNAKLRHLRTTAMYGYSRVTPADIYREAGSDKDRIRRLMKRHGYIL